MSAATEDDARQRLREELIRRQNAGDVDFTFADAIQRTHLNEPVPGMYAMDNDLYLELRHSGASQQDFARAFKEAEEKRQSGEPYTFEDYVRGRDA